MSDVSKIRFGRIVVGAFLAEATVLALFFVFLGIAMLAGVPELAAPMTPFDYADAMVGSFVSMFFFAQWVCRRVESRFVLHGALVGIVAFLLFATMWFVLSGRFWQPALYWVAHGLKIAGGIAGGMVAERRAPRRIYGNAST